MEYTKDHFCPVYKRIIDIDLCYDSLNCLNGFYRIESTRELLEVKDIEGARKICVECPYSDLDAGLGDLGW